jgi:hypothetical protein
MSGQASKRHFSLVSGLEQRKKQDNDDLQHDHDLRSEPGGFNWRLRVTFKMPSIVAFGNSACDGFRLAETAEAGGDRATGDVY